MWSRMARIVMIKWKTSQGAGFVDIDAPQVTFENVFWKRSCKLLNISWYLTSLRVENFGDDGLQMHSCLRETSRGFDDGSTC